MLLINNIYIVYHQSLSFYEDTLREQLFQEIKLLIKPHYLEHKNNWKKLCPFTLSLHVDLFLIRV